MSNTKQLVAILAIPGLIFLSAVGYGVYKAGEVSGSADTEVLQADLDRTEEARQVLNDELWEERQRIEQLEKEKTDLGGQVDVATTDRERIREEYANTLEATIFFFQDLKTLEAQEYFTLCDLWGRGSIEVEDLTDLESPSEEQKDFFGLLLEESCTDAYYQ